MDERPHLIVIGNGTAASRAVDELLACRPRRHRRITVPGVEPSPACKHVLSSAILGGRSLLSAPHRFPERRVGRPPGVAGRFALRHAAAGGVSPSL